MVYGSIMSMIQSYVSKTQQLDAAQDHASSSIDNNATNIDCNKSRIKEAKHKPP